MKRAGFVLLALLAAPALAAGVQPLTPADVPALLQAPKQGVKVIEFWSLDCAYCETNLKAVARLKADHPRRVQVVLVATDNIAHAQALQSRLRKAGVGHLPARAYAAASRQRLDYLIDPTWGGVTPRTLVIHADGTRRATSGELTAQRLRALVADKVDKQQRR